MYHGSSEQFTQFDRRKAKGSGSFGRGFYFTNSDSHASTYGNLYKVYLNVENPVEYGRANITRAQLEAFLEAVAENEDYSIENYGTYDAAEIANNILNRESKIDAFRAIQDVSITAIGDMVEAVELFNSVNGTDFDGIVSATETVAFYPEQVKRVDNKNPTSSRDIRYSAKDEVDVEAGGETEFEQTRAKLTEVKKEKAKVQGQYTRHKNADERRKYRERSLRSINELYQLIAHPSTKKNAPESVREPIARFLRALEMEGRMVQEEPTKPTPPGANATPEQVRSYKARMVVYERRLEAFKTNSRQKTGRSMKWAEQMNFLSQALAGLNPDSGSDAGFSLVIHPALAERMSEFAKANASVSISEMKAAQLKELSEILSQIKSAISKSNKQIRTQRAVTTAAFGTASIAEMESRKKFNNSPRGQMYNLGMHHGVGQMDAISYFERLGDTAALIGRELREGQDEYINHIRETVEFASDAFNPKDAHAWQDEKSAKTFHLKDGDVTLTPAQIMNLYLLSQRGDARSHLEGDGIEVIRKNGRKTVYENSRITEEDIRTIIGTLTDEQRAVAKKLQQYMQTVAGWGNEATLEAYGFRRFGDNNYWRMKVSGTSVASKADQSVKNADLFALVNSGFTKETQKNATNALIIEDVFTAFAEHCVEMAEYSAYLVPVIDAMKWYNWRGKDANTGRTIETKRAMRDSFGDDALRFFENFMGQINGGANRNVPRTLIDKATRLVKRASVGANLSVIAQQPTAIVRAVAMIDPKYVAQGAMGGWNVKLAERYSPIVYWKSIGYFDTGVGRSVADTITGAGTLIEKLGEAQMAPAGFADMVAWNALWNACYAEQKAKHPNQSEEYYKSDAFYQIVGNRLSEVIDKTQVVDSVFHRSAIAASGAAQAFTAFSSEMMKSYNLLTNAFYDARFYNDKEHNSKLRRTVLAHTLNAFAAAMAQAVVGAWRDDDEDKTDERLERWLTKGYGKYTYGERWRVRAAENVIDNLAPWNLVWISKTAIELLGGAYSTSSRVDTKLFSAIGSAIKDAGKIAQACITVANDKDLYELNNTDTFYERVLEEANVAPSKVLYRAVSAFSYATGFGFSNVWRDVQGALSNAKRPDTWTLKDGLYFIEHNDMASASVAINAAIEVKTEVLAAEYPQYSEERAREVAESKLRSEVTSTYKASYVEAYIKGYTNRAGKIRSYMIATGLYGDDDEAPKEVDSVLQDWVVAELKNTYLTARTPAQVQRAIDYLWNTGKWKTEAELNDQLEAWREA